jgi:hypothetical protein
MVIFHGKLLNNQRVTRKDFRFKQQTRWINLQPSIKHVGFTTKHRGKPCKSAKNHKPGLLIASICSYHIWGCYHLPCAHWNTWKIKGALCFKLSNYIQYLQAWDWQERQDRGGFCPRFGGICGPPWGRQSWWYHWNCWSCIGRPRLDKNFHHPSDYQRNSGDPWSLDATTFEESEEIWCTRCAGKWLL